MIGMLFAPEPALLKIARRRYPDVDPLLAADFVRSDRREAGLGALDEKKRLSRGPTRGEVYAYKVQDPMRGSICYRWGVRRPQRYEYPRMPLPLYVGVCAAESATVTRTVIPARDENWAIGFNRRDFDDQRGRTIVARTLRQARRDARAGKIKQGD